MKLTSRWITYAALAAGFLAASAGVQAQGGAPEAPPPPRGVPAIFDRLGQPDFDFIGIEGPAFRKTVTGAPFTATFSSQLSQTLADGNHITHSSNGNIVRDSQGRTRRDVTLPAIRGLAASGQNAPHFVMINDPVAGTRFILHPNEKTADSLAFHGKGGRPKGMAPQHRGEAEAWAGKHSDEVTSSSLGTQTIGGVVAEGTRITRTIPAGEIGNEKPIQIVTERWYSSDLQTVVMVKRTDPLHGDSSFQLTGIQRDEPAATLFQVPADYTVNSAPAGRRMRTLPAAPQPPAE